MTVHKVVAGLLGAVLAASVGTAIAAPGKGPTVTVERVVDGDTLVVVGNKQRQIRLVNVDAPERTGEDPVATCLGEEAAGFLEALLPPGTNVRLLYDGARKNDLGLEVAAVEVEGRLVNAELAQAGLGVAVRAEEHGRYFPAVAAAQTIARERRDGLHDPDIPCTLPARLAALEAEVVRIQEMGTTADLEVLRELELRAEQAAETAQALRATLGGESDAYPLAGFSESIGALSLLVDVSDSRIVRGQDEIREAILAQGGEPDPGARDEGGAAVGPGGDRPSAQPPVPARDEAGGGPLPDTGVGSDVDGAPGRPARGDSAANRPDAVAPGRGPTGGAAPDRGSPGGGHASDAPGPGSGPIPSGGPTPSDAADDAPGQRAAAEAAANRAAADDAARREAAAQRSAAEAAARREAALQEARRLEAEAQRQAAIREAQLKAAADAATQREVAARRAAAEEARRRAAERATAPAPAATAEALPQEAAATGP